MANMGNNIILKLKKERAFFFKMGWKIRIINSNNCESTGI